MPSGEEVVNDYRFLELSLRAHPASFLRTDLARRGIVCNEKLRVSPSGTRVSVSGLVTIRQRPGSANGVIFMTKSRSAAHIGGVMPSRPTETADASSVPSSFLFAPAMKILAPGLSSLLSPET